MNSHLHLFNNLHSLKGIKVILRLITIGYYSAIFQGNKYLLPMKLSVFFRQGLKLLAAFSITWKIKLEELSISKCEGLKNISIYFPFWIKFQPLRGTTRKWDFQGLFLFVFLNFPVGFGFYFPWLLRSWKTVCLSWLALSFFPFGKYSSISNLYLVEEKPT